MLAPLDRTCLSRSRVTAGVDEDSNPWWSPSGEWIYFSRAYAQSDLYRLHPDGSGLERLTSTRKVGEDQVTLHGDGTIAVVVTEQSDSRIALFLDGEIIAVTEGPSDRSVTFVPRP